MIEEFDKKGNRLYKDGINLKLKLVGEKFTRTIGQIINRVWFTDKSKKAHFMRANKSFALCHAALLNANKFGFDKINVKDNKRQSEITVEKWLESKDFMNFSEEGFELQLFYKLHDLWNVEENDKAVQDYCKWAER